MSLQPAVLFNAGTLQPINNPDLARQIAVKLGASVTLLKGTVLGEVTTGVNAAQTIDTTGVPTGGTFKLGFRGSTTTALAFDCTLAAMDAALEALASIGAGNVTCTGGALPTEILVTFTGDLAAQPVELITLVTNALTGGTAPTVTIVNTTPGITDKGFKAYATGSSDGSETARGFLAIDCYTDANGLITYGLISTGGEHGEKHLTAPLWVHGDFDSRELVGLDAAGLADMGGRIISGTVAAGVVSI